MTVVEVKANPQGLNGRVHLTLINIFNVQILYFITQNLFHFFLDLHSKKAEWKIFTREKKEHLHSEFSFLSGSKV